MALLISTNMYRAEDLKRVFLYLEEFPGVGVEVFPMFHEKGYEELLKECLPRLGEVPISFHGPYYRAEHSVTAEERPAVYEDTMRMVDQTLEYCRILGSRYMVFHHNNCRVTPEKKEEMIRVACENFRVVEKLYEPYRIPVVVENAGVRDRKNMLLDQKEFIDLCRKENYRVLIDIGHAHANGWDLPYVIESLKDQIVAYHLHNNDGIHDSHQRIHNGSLDFEAFAAACRSNTPDADWVLEYAVDVADDEDGIREDLKYLRNF